MAYYFKDDYVKSKWNFRCVLYSLLIPLLPQLCDPILRGCPSLTSLRASRCVFTHKRSKDVSIPNSWKTLFSSVCCLENLDLSSCKLPVEALKSVPMMLLLFLDCSLIIWVPVCLYVCLYVCAHIVSKETVAHHLFVCQQLDDLRTEYLPQNPDIANTLYTNPEQLRNTHKYFVMASGRRARAQWLLDRINK